MSSSNLCSECQCSFASFSNLRRHVRKYHTEKLDELAPLQVKSYSFQCTYCKKYFSHRRTMRVHLKKTHTGNDLSTNVQTSIGIVGQKCPLLALLQVKSYSFQCTYCKKYFSHRRTMRVHLKKTHTGNDLSTNVQTSIGIVGQKCPLCDFVGKFKCDFYSHYKMEHDINVQIEQLKFSSSDEFCVWLANIEKESQSKFIKERGSTSTKRSYVCHRSGFFKSTSTGKRHLKSQGSKKINGFCPAGLQVSVDKEDGSHKVDFVKTHVGHQNDLCHLFLSHEEHETLAMKIAMKIPFDEILDDIRHRVTNSSLERLDLLTKKDLFNIEACYNLHSTSQRHHNDAIRRVTESQLIFDQVSTCQGKKSLSEKKKKLIEKLLSDINSIESEEQLAAIEKLFNSVGPTLRALSQEMKPAPMKTKEPHNNKILPQRRLFSTRKHTKKPDILQNLPK